MAKKDATGHIEQLALYQDAVLATPSAPTAVDTSGGEGGGFLIHVNAGITLDATNRIDIKAYKGTTAALAEAAGSPVVSEDIGGGVTIAGGIIASIQLAATGLAGYFVPYVGDEAFVTAIANFEGTHGTVSEVSIQYVKTHLKNQQ